MILDCAVIGGGPAGLNAALVLGRSRRKAVLFDDNKPRNAALEYTLNEQGGIATDNWQRTNTEGVFAYGDTRIAGPSQLIIAAAEGSMAALSVIGALVGEKFNEKK